MERQFSGADGLSGDHRPAIARIRLRGWFAIRLESISRSLGRGQSRALWALLDGKATQAGAHGDACGENAISAEQNGMRKIHGKRPGTALPDIRRTFERWMGMVKARKRQNQWDLCLPLKSWFVPVPASASSRERMSITGFFHSRFCGTLADAGCWAFTLRVDTRATFRAAGLGREL
jgi:hypothetical protein